MPTRDSVPSSELASLQAQLDAVTRERDEACAVIVDVIDRLNKHCRALRFQRTTSANVADLVDAICATDTRHVQEKQQAEARLTALEAGLRTYGRHKADCEAVWSAAFKCSGCGYVTANRTEDRQAFRACKGYCGRDKDCPLAWPCPQCSRIHYWGGWKSLKRDCTCGFAALSPATEA